MNAALLFSALFAGAWLVAGCGAAAAPAAALPGEEVLERGGELRAERPERALLVTREWVSVWGLTEVPDGSRLQLGLSGVDAITRSELLKAVRVRVGAVVTDVESTDPRRRSLLVETTERVSGLLARGQPLPHGWARIRRGERVERRLWARQDVRRAELEAALQEPLEGSGAEVRGFVGGLVLASGAEAAAP